MTSRQQRFVAEYAIDGNAAAAARRAGYSARSARVNGPRLLSNAAVRKAIQDTQREIARRLTLEREDVLQGLLEGVEAAKLHADPSAMIRGWVEIGRMAGFYGLDRRGVDVMTTPGPVVRSLDALSDDDLLSFVANSSGPY